MNSYKEFLLEFRKKEFENVCILVLDENIAIKLNHYVRLVCDLKLNKEAYYLYYGQVKVIVKSFTNYWCKTIDDCVKNADKYSNSDLRTDLLELMEETILMQQEKQIVFGNEYLPIETTAEKLKYDEMEKLFEEFMEKLQSLREFIVKFDKKEQVVAFVKAHFKISLKYYHDLFDFAHSFIGMMLFDRITELKISLEEIKLRLKNNLDTFQGEVDDEHKFMLDKLYEKNKEQILLLRREKKSVSELAEVKLCIEKLSKKIIKTKKQVAGIVSLYDEVAYWETRVNDFYIIYRNLTTLKEERDHLKKQQEKYDSLKTLEYPGEKYDAWQNIGENYAQHRQLIESKIVEAAKTLMSFFYIIGQNVKISEDDVGQFYSDSQGHHVYCMDYGLHMYHVVCDGYKEIIDKDEYFYDRHGRYVLDKDGTKLYKRSHCASCYNLNEHNQFVKVSKDCGHSERYNEDCMQNFKDPNDDPLFPTLEPTDIKRTLDKNVTTYLWKCFGHILPEVLRDVGSLKPKNPIPYMAHRLLYYKYQKTNKETAAKKKEASLYRETVFQTRKETAVKEAKLHRAKQVKPRKPEESDDAEERAIYNSYVATQNLIKSLDFYN